MKTKVAKTYKNPKHQQTRQFGEEIQDVEFQEITPKKSETDNLFLAYAFFHHTGKAVVLPALLIAFIGYACGDFPLEVLAAVGIVLFFWASGAGFTLYRMEKGGRK